MAEYLYIQFQRWYQVDFDFVALACNLACPLFQLLGEFYHQASRLVFHAKPGALLIKSG